MVFYRQRGTVKKMGEGEAGRGGGNRNDALKSYDSYGCFSSKRQFSKRSHQKIVLATLAAVTDFMVIFKGL